MTEQGVNPGETRSRPQPSSTLVADHLGHLLEIAQLEDRGFMSQGIVREVSQVMGTPNCSLYLLPQFVPEFNGELIDPRSHKINYTYVQQDYIVSAHSTAGEAEIPPFGKAFYHAGCEDLANESSRDPRTSRPRAPAARGPHEH